MKKTAYVIVTAIICWALLLSGCSLNQTDPPQQGSLSGTALAEALLANERINREHLSHSFDFLDERLKKESKSNLGLSFLSSKKADLSVKGEIISGSGDNAVYSWNNFIQLITELSYFQSHFRAGQSFTDRIDNNIEFVQSKTDIKNKWLKNLSYIDYLMQVEHDREIIYAIDESNEIYSVGIRSVNDELNTTYEYYEHQTNGYLRTLATPNRRYEYSTVSNSGEVVAFVADNDNGYWRLLQFLSHNGQLFTVNMIILTDSLAYSATFNISSDTIYHSNVKLLSPDLKYEIAGINGDLITVYPGSFTGINELRISVAEQKAMGEPCGKVLYVNDHGYYYSYAPADIHTSKGVIKAPRFDNSDGQLHSIPTARDQNVGYYNGNVQGLWEDVYPELTFEVKGDTYREKFNNLHAALEAYGIRPLYNKGTVGIMVDDVFKMLDGFMGHYSWNGQVISGYNELDAAIATERTRNGKYEQLLSNAKQLPEATKQELVEMQQNAAFPSLSFGADATASVKNGKVTLSGVTVTVNKDDILELNKQYVVRIALKKNTDELEELVTLDNLLNDTLITYSGDSLTMTLNGEFSLPSSVSEGEYDIVAYAATAEKGIRVSKFSRVLCLGQVNDKISLRDLDVVTVITADKYLRSTYTRNFDLTAEIDTAQACTYDYVLSVMEDAILSSGYFVPDAKIEAYDPQTNTSTPVSDGVLASGSYRIQYYGRVDGGEITAYVYCDIK